MTRQQAWELLGQHLKNKNLLKHSLAVEACLREFAGRLGEDQELWGVTGLLHDLDYEYTVNQPEQHTLKTAEILGPKGVAAEIIHAIKSHNRQAEVLSRLDQALTVVDPVTGFIIACALMHPEKKLASLDLVFLKNRFKEKSFAKGASRDQMRDCEKLGLTLDDFMQTALQAMQRISGDLGL